MNPRDFAIVIGRQCGSGGRELGKKLAARLGITYYDRSLLRQASEKLGMRHDLLERHDERRPSKIGAWLAATCGAADASFSDATLAGGGLHRLQGNVVRELLEKGSCVIVGRGADYIGRDLPHLFSVYLHAPLPARINRLKERESQDMTDSEIEDLIVRTDRRRSDYYNDFTGRRWGACHNYHLSIDTSIADSDSIVNLIIGCLESKCDKGASTKEKINENGNQS